MSFINNGSQTLSFKMLSLSELPTSILGIEWLIESLFLSCNLIANVIGILNSKVPP